MIVPVKKEHRSAGERSITKVPSGPVSSLGNISPQNCCSPCPYGHGRSFCFPCYKKIMTEHYGIKKDKGLVDRKYDKETAVYGSTI